MSFFQLQSKHYQKTIKGHFDFIRKKFFHPGNKGSHNEEVLRRYLKTMLPSNLKIGHGEVIDTHKKKSKQIDVIIVDSALQAFIDDYSLPNMFIIESVYMAGEVKAILKKVSLKQALENCKAFKALTPSFTKWDSIVCNDEDLQRFYEKRGFFIFAFKTEMELDTIQKELKEHYQDAPITEQVDAIFCLDKGAIINFGNGQGALKYSLNGKDVGGYHKVAGAEEVIEKFTSWTLCTMPKIFTANNPLIHYCMPVKK